MPEEHPPLGKSFVLEYDSEVQTYPVIGISKEKNLQNFTSPAALSAHPDSATYPNHLFVGTRFSAGDQRVLWIYQILPSQWTYSPVSVDVQSLAPTLVKKRKNRINTAGGLPAFKPGAVINTGINGALTAVLTAGVVTSVTIGTAGTGYGELVGLSFAAPGSGVTATGYAWSVAGIITQIVITNGGSGYGSSAPVITVLPNSLTITEREDVSDYVAYEVVRCVAQSQFFDLAHALQGTRYQGYRYPPRINISYLDYYGSTVGSRTPTAGLVPCNTYTYYVFSDTKPAISVDLVIFDTIEINNIVYRDVLHDDTTRTYNGLLLFIPKTTPSFTEYVGGIGLTGTSITLTNSSTGVVGVGTSFLSQVQVGDLVMGFQNAVVQSITNDTNIVLTAAFTGTTATFSVGPFVTRASYGWIGNEKVIDADVVPQEYGKYYRITIVKTIMR